MLPKESTVLSLHAAGSAYHQGVLENLQRAIGEGLNPALAVVRVGLKGSGQSPNYRIESPELVETHTITIRLPSGANKDLPITNTGLYKIFRGPTHKEKSELDDLESHPENWSLNTLTLEELQS